MFYVYSSQNEAGSTSARRALIKHTSRRLSSQLHRINAV